MPKIPVGEEESLFPLKSVDCFLVLKFSVGTEGPQSPFHHILPKCKLARDLKETYDR